MKEKQLHWSIPNAWTWHWTERKTRFQKQPLSSALLQINATPCNDLIFADGLWFYYFSSSLTSSYGQQYWWFYCQSPESKFVQKSYRSSSFPKPLYCRFISTINIDHYLHISIAVAVESSKYLIFFYLIELGETFWLWVVELSCSVVIEDMSKNFGISIKEVLFEYFIIKEVFLVWSEQSIGILLQRILPRLKPLATNIDH